MRTTVDLPDDLFRRAKATAAMRGLKLKELFTRLIEEGLQVHPQDSSAMLPRNLPQAIRRATGTPIPALSPAELEAILQEEDAPKQG